MAKDGTKTYWPIDKLIGWSKNPRSTTPEDKERLKKQIRDLGVYKPLIVTIEVDRAVVLGGNMRLQALKEMHADNQAEYAEVWVSIVDAKDDKTRLEYALSDNDRAGKYEEKQLFDLIQAYQDFDTSLYSIDSRTAYSLEDLVDRYTETEEDEFDADKEAAKITNPVSKPGMIYQLGEHRLMCGSATNPDHVLALTGGVLADMAFTDPPYNVDYSGRGKKTSNKIMNDNMGGSQFLAFLSDTFASYRLALAESAPMYVCYASRTHREFENALEANGYKVKNQIIWSKAVASMGWGDYRWKHEPILYCSVEGKKVPFYGDRKQYTTWEKEPTDAELLLAARQMLEQEEDAGITVWSLNRDSGYVHPTQKPIALIEIALKNSSKPGDYVLDLFGGSGSTLMACEQLDRVCYTLELDPKYCDVIVARWEKFTNQKAEIVKNGD